MRPRHAVLLTPSKSSHHIQLLSRQHFVRVNALDATLMVFPASAANKRLAVALSPLDATLTKTTGGLPPEIDSSAYSASLRFDLPSLSTYNSKLTTDRERRALPLPCSLFNFQSKVPTVSGSPVTKSPVVHPLPAQLLTKCYSRNSFVLKTIHFDGECVGAPPAAQTFQPFKPANIPMRYRPISFRFIFLRTLLHSPKNQLLSFQAIPHSLPKTPGVGG